jgi:hypothetical protein
LQMWYMVIIDAVIYGACHIHIQIQFNRQAYVVESITVI